MRPGFHLSNCSLITPADEDIIRRWAPLSALLAMNNIVEDNAECDKLVRVWEVAGRPLLVLRKYFEPSCGPKPGFWGVHANESVAMAKRCIARGIPVGRIALKPFNEPNMPTWAMNEPYGEGFGDRPEEITRYNDALKTFIMVAKNQLPDVLIGGPHLTVGNRDVRFPNDPEGRYYYGPNSLCAEALAMLDLHFVHCYGFRQGQYKDRAHGLRFLEYEKYFSGKPIYIVEGMYGEQRADGSSIDPRQNTIRGEETVAYLRLLDQYPQVKGITLWIGGNTGWDTHRHSDGWDASTHRPVVHYVEQYVRGELPPAPEPEPEPQPQPEPIPTPEVPTAMEYVGLSKEMKARLTVTPADTSKPYWKITRVEIQPQTDNQSAWAIAPKGHIPTLFWVGGGAAMPWKGPDAYSPPGAREGGYSQPMFHAWGNYGVRMEGNSEVLFGFGLYGPNLEITYTAHRPVLVYFQLAQADIAPGPAPEPPPVIPPGPEPVPQPQPVPDVPYTLLAGLRRLGLVVEDFRDRVKAVSKVGQITSRPPAKINGIVIHHTASNGPQTPMGIVDYHIKTRGFPTVGYHFIIGWEGGVYFMAPLAWVTPHCGYLNAETIGIAVMGDFTSDLPSNQQLKSLRLLIWGLEEWLDGSWGHQRRAYVLPHNYLQYVNEQGQPWRSTCPGKLKEALVWAGEWPGRSV